MTIFHHLKPSYGDVLPESNLVIIRPIDPHSVQSGHSQSKLAIDSSIAQMNSKNVKVLVERRWKDSLKCCALIDCF